MGPPPQFEIHESKTGTGLRLSLRGELDLATAPILEERLTRLRASRAAVRLDLSGLEFIDSTGIHLLVRMVGDAQTARWQLQIEPDVAPRVMKLFRLMNIERIVLRGDSSGA